MIKNKTKVPFVLISITLIITAGLQQCTINPKRLYKEKIKKADIELNWFYYSLISNTTPDYVTTTNKNEIDTILISNLITDIYIKKDTVFLELYSSPTFEGESFKIPNQTLGYYIKVDSTHKKRPTKIIREFTE